MVHIDYNKENSGTSKYSSEYAKVLFSIAKNTNDNFFKISVAENYPLKSRNQRVYIYFSPKSRKQLIIFFYYFCVTLIDTAK